MRRTVLPALVLSAPVAVSPALADERPAVHASAGPVILSDVELDRVVGGDASCVNCTGMSVSDNDAAVTVVVRPGPGATGPVRVDRGADDDDGASCVNCTGSSVNDNEATVTVVVRPGPGATAQVRLDQAAGGDASCVNCTGSSVSANHARVTVVVGPDLGTEDLAGLLARP